MDAELKNRVRTDLESFLKNRSYYHRLGRVWKRSYLLYGPPGTGKSTFAAAMARFLCYDLYDLDLAGCSSNGGDLKDLLLQTTPQSVIVVEDLDRHLRTAAAAPSLESSLAGILNFMDGIFSCCGEERVMVFTMSGLKERVDTAVLRPGRLDVHIHFPLCNFPTFKTMASSYLGLKDHKLYPQVEEIFDGGASLSQAEIGEIMISNRGSTSRALKMVITALREQQKKQPVPPAPLPLVSGHRRGCRRCRWGRLATAAAGYPAGGACRGGLGRGDPEGDPQALRPHQAEEWEQEGRGRRLAAVGGPLAAAAVEKEITC
ncbi:unnamed protein product [Spirodela intermedia]|uniref:AAA+ ATPase domain-containing protein n=1 Tax=Spirodela intermedia TaxID=51605 RepID=A0A7I8J0K6_SPIIN|nr:unnamed protein product [Spirodela intermedia]CAA6663343.1 unnamed protein product [Spirodela intermedia]